MKERFSLLAGYFSLAQPKGKVGTALGVLAEIFTILFGGWDKLLTTLLIFMIFDYASGIWAAAKGKSNKTATGRLSSKAGWDGLAKKAITLMVVLAACRLDLVATELGMELPFNISVRAMVIGFYIGVEGISLLENYKAVGGDKIPPILSLVLDRLLDGGEAHENKPEG